MIQTSPRTKILMDLQLLKKIKKEEYLKLYNTEIIMKNRLYRFQTSKFAKKSNNCGNDDFVSLVELWSFFFLEKRIGRLNQTLQRTDKPV